MRAWHWFRNGVLSIGTIGIATLVAIGSSEKRERTDAAPKAGTFTNPLRERNGADPWLFWQDGSYFLSTTTARDIRLRQSETLEGLKTAADQVIWKDTNPERSQDLWAPEFHRLESGSGPRWYVYYTAGDGEEPNHRMYVLESQGDDPRGPYTFKSKLLTDPDDAQFAIDGTVIARPDGRLDFVWCGRPSQAGQSLYIARMKNPWTLEGPRKPLEADGFGCAFIREGPEALVRNGRVFLVYSACSADTPDYRLGMLTASDQADLLDPAAWSQSPAPVFERDDQHGIFGPGHCSFFRSPDGKEDWLAYHAKPSTDKGFEDRSTRAQPFTWKADGSPNFGRPVPTGQVLNEPSGTRPAGR